jgi:hypothetical protein
MRHQAELAWDSIQLAHIAELQNLMVDYATRAWRPIDIAPPVNVSLVCVVEEGITIMIKTDLGEWRTSLGTPHKPPSHWMPCPVMPKSGNGRRSLISGKKEKEKVK